MSWVNRKIDNPNSIFMYCENGKPYFQNRVSINGFKVVRQPVLIYLKETKNSFPFKVLDTLNFVFNGSIDLFDKKQPLFLEDREIN